MKKILFLAANPKETSQLRLDEELREIAEGLQRAKKRNNFNLVQKWAVRPRDIQRAMLDINPQIVHFSGHGKGDNGLIFEDKQTGKAKLIDAEALSDLFRLFADKVECVVLNACYSEAQADSISNFIPYVIGMSEAIGDIAAINFSVGFYDAIGAGRSIEFAYELGCNSIRLDGINEHSTPILINKGKSADNNDNSENDKFLELNFDSQLNYSLPPICTNLPSKLRLPYRSLGMGFVGRTHEIFYLDYILRTEKSKNNCVAVINGMGGIGKTQLAIEYVNRFGDRFLGGIFWVDAERGLSAMITQVAQYFDIILDNALEEKVQLMQLWNKLSISHQAILIIFDNFPEDQSLSPWLPTTGLTYVLVTTKRRDLYNYPCVSLNFISENEGVELLNSGERKFGDEAKKLIKILGGLPLSLELTKYFLNIKSDLTIEKLIQEIKKVGNMKVLDIFSKKYSDELPTGHIKEVSATFKMSWDIASSTAKSILEIISLLAPTPVPRYLFNMILEINSENILEDPIDEAIDEISKKLSLVELDKDNDPLMHRLLSGFIRENISNDSNMFNKISSAITECMTKAIDENNYQYYKLEKIIPHGEFLLSSGNIDNNASIFLSRFISRHHWRLGRYRLAEKYGRISLKFSEEYYELGHPEISKSQYYLVVVLRSLGMLSEAEKLARKALESDLKTYDSDNPEVAIKQSHLALVLWEIGRLNEAKTLLEKALESTQKHYKNSHPEIAIKQCNLGKILQDLGEVDSASQYFRKALESDLNHYKSEHPKIAYRQSKLALSLRELGKFEEAKDLLKKALKSDMDNYKDGHPWIAESKFNLATVLYHTGDFEEAKNLLVEAIESDKKNFESEHHAISIKQSYLALVLQKLKKYDKAQKIANLAFENLNKNMGAQHRLTIIAKNNCETVLQNKTC